MNDPRLNIFAQRALSTKETVYNSFGLAEDMILKNVEGDFVECGVFAGTQVAAMSHAIQKHNSKKKVHCFDSFEGIPMAGKHDIEIRGCIGKPTEEGALKTTGVSACSLEQVRAHLKEWGFPMEYFHFYKGWFQNTVPSCNIDKIALLRLDGDLYESTKVCLEHLGPRVQKGGVIIIDDWALDGCQKAVREWWKQHNISPVIHTVPNSTPVYFYL